MDVRSELARERADLARADRDLREGEARIAAQDDLVSRLRAGGRDIREAERLLGLLRDTLRHWRQHRVLILERITDLESRPSAAGPAPGSVGDRTPPAMRGSSRKSASSA